MLKKEGNGIVVLYRTKWDVGGLRVIVFATPLWLLVLVRCGEPEYYPSEQADKSDYDGYQARIVGFDVVHE